MWAQKPQLEQAIGQWAPAHPANCLPSSSTCDTCKNEIATCLLDIGQGKSITMYCMCNLESKDLLSGQVSASELDLLSSSPDTRHPPSKSCRRYTAQGECFHSRPGLLQQTLRHSMPPISCEMDSSVRVTRVGKFFLILKNF